MPRASEEGLPTTINWTIWPSRYVAASYSMQVEIHRGGVHREDANQRAYVTLSSPLQGYSLESNLIFTNIESVVGSRFFPAVRCRRSTLAAPDPGPRITQLRGDKVAAAYLHS